MSRLFDPVSLLNENMGANETRRTPLPVGETTAQITEIKLKDGKAGPSAKNPGAPWYRLDCTLEITDPEYLASDESLKGRDKLITYYGVMLDMTDGQISQGPNKNIKLGQLRAAAGVNGQPLGMLSGQQIRIMIGHKPHPTETDPETGNPVILDEVVAVTKV